MFYGGFLLALFYAYAHVHDDYYYALGYVTSVDKSQLSRRVVMLASLFLAVDNKLRKLVVGSQKRQQTAREIRIDDDLTMLRDTCTVRK